MKVDRSSFEFFIKLWRNGNGNNKRLRSNGIFPKSWNKAKPNLQLKKFMDYLAYKNIPMGLTSGVCD